MSHLCFGTYCTTVKKTMLPPNGNVDAVSLLLSFVTERVTIYCKQTKKDINEKKPKQPFVLTDKIASVYLNCKEPILADIVEATSRITITKAAEAYFRDEVVPAIDPVLVENLIMDIQKIYTNDADVPARLKDKWNELANQEHLVQFLRELFFYSIKKPNVWDEPISATEYFDAEAAISEMDQAIAILKKYPRPKEIPVPENPLEEEMEYIIALLNVYAEELQSGKGITVEDVKITKFKEHLLIRRKEYFAAEAIREGTKDNFGDKEEVNFTTLKDDIYEGVYDKYISQYGSSLERLTQVLNTAATYPATRSILLSKLDWISAREKKGVCHFLVRDGKLTWVVDE